MRKITYYLIALTIIGISAFYFQLDEGGTSIGRLIAVPALLSWGIYKLQVKRFRPWGMMMFAMVAFIVYSALSISWSVDIDSSIYSFSRLLVDFVLVLMIWDMGLSGAEAQGLMQAFIIAFYIGFASVIRNYGAGEEHYSERFSSSGFDPNEVGFFVLLGLPVAWYLATSKEPIHWLLRFLNLGYPFIAIITLVLTATRGGFIFAIPNVLLILFSLKRAPRWLSALLLTGLAAVIPLGLIGPLQPQFARLGTALSSVGSDGGNGRIEGWQNAWDVFTKNPIIGTGLTTSRTMSLRYPTEHIHGVGLITHSMYLMVMSDLGIIGLLVLLCIFYGMISPLKGAPRDLKLAAGVSVFTFLAGNAQIPETLSQTNWIYMGVMGGWLMALQVERTQKLKDRAQVSQPIPTMTPKRPMQPLAG